MRIHGAVYRKGWKLYGRWRENGKQPIATLCDYDPAKHGQIKDGEFVSLRRRTPDVIEAFEKVALARLNAPKSAPRVAPAVSIERGDAPSSETTIGEFFEKTFLPNMRTLAQPKTDAPLRASTLKDYQDVWRCHLERRIGHMPLKDFSVHDGDTVMADIQRANPMFTKSTLARIKALMHRIFGEAVREKALSLNPMLGVRTPAGQPSAKMCAYSPEQVQRMIGVLPEPARTIVALAAFTGLRKSEIRGLRWEDYRDGLLHVTRSIWRTIENAPKTRASRAPVPVIPKLAAMLAPMRKTSGPMFAGEKGKPLQLDNLYRRTMKDILAASNIPWHGWHGFRRGLATLLNERGTDLKTTQGILRHREPAVTLDHYIQESEKLQRDALRKINRLCTPCAPERVN